MKSQANLITRFHDGARTGTASNMFIEGDALYSYGHRFPLAVRRDWGAGIRYLINGDRYSRSTACHQQQCIRTLSCNVQVPFSALVAAGLTDWQRSPVATLAIVACRPDRCYETCAHCGRDVTYSDDRLADGQFRGHLHQEDSTPICAEAEGRIASHHVLGAVVLERDGAFYLSSVDENENWRVRAYFLCQLPRAVASVEDAFASLAPEEILSARSKGADVRRQGDIFVVRSDVPTRSLPGPSHRQHPLFGTAHIATEARVNGAVFVRGTLRHAPRGRRAQHQSLRLGNSWWAAHKNLALGSWYAIGNVD